MKQKEPIRHGFRAQTHSFSLPPPVHAPRGGWRRRGVWCCVFLFGRECLLVHPLFEGGVVVPSNPWSAYQLLFLFHTQSMMTSFPQGTPMQTPKYLKAADLVGMLAKRLKPNGLQYRGELSTAEQTDQDSLAASTPQAHGTQGTLLIVLHSVAFDSSVESTLILPLQCGDFGSSLLERVCAFNGQTFVDGTCVTQGGAQQCLKSELELLGILVFMESIFGLHPKEIGQISGPTTPVFITSANFKCEKP